MTYIGLTREKNMYFGASKELILRARELRKEMTKAEMVLWSFLRKHQLDGAIFRRQHPIDIFIADFYCHKFRLIIEVDGGIHNHQDISERDENRTAELKNLGLKIIRFTNEDVLFHTEKVLNIIRNNLNP
ncbi:MAG: endonuclease domain-containing protein [Bacteroidales bacterium]|nr:endonuclease domain-containing protein [Bacteroidales bacterium]MCB9013688.1 endonuclease domain-containing protein [Bacteroidales bacterium]